MFNPNAVQEILADALKYSSGSTAQRSRRYAECVICSRMLRKCDMKEHLLQAHQLTIITHIFKCEHCAKQFGEKRLLQRHVERVHERLVKATCATCGKSFRDVSNYNQHLLIHTGTRSYVCQICGKAFAQPQGLRMHMPAHQTGAGFPCPLCSKHFRRKQHMELHVLKHTGKKTHQCETCGKAFASKNELKMHSWIHKEEWPFICSICGKGFNQSHGLKCHMRNHHTLGE